MTIKDCLKRQDKAYKRAIIAKRQRKWKKALKMFMRYGQRAFAMKGADDEP